MEDGDILSGFFGLWSAPDAARRSDTLRGTVVEGVTYADAHAPGPIVGPAALSEFLDAFTSNVPDAAARIVAPVDMHHGHARAIVRFVRGGHAFASGQCFAETASDGRSSRVIGFMGKGPE